MSKRTVAAQSQSADGQRGHEGSSLEMKLPGDWTELPAELLEMIFDNLRIDDIDSVWFSKEQRKPLLNCRLAHSRWKSATDDFLEKRSLSFWKKWKEHDCNPYKFPVVHFNSYGKQTLGNILFPSFLQGDIESCPFPTKSICLTHFLPVTSAQTCGENWVLSPIRDAHFFSRYGDHLTSMTIEYLDGRKDFTAQTLQQLMTYTPNLKAMTLEDITIKLLEKDVGKITLPPLPHLEHVRLYGIKCRGFKYDAQNWILEPYKGQLISVNCFEELGCENSPVNFPSLKMLKLQEPTRRQLLAPVMYPSLKSLELIKIKLNENIGPGQIKLQHVFKCISGVASTLVDLQLDIMFGVKLMKYKNAEYFQEVREIQERGFPTLKTLTITYPKYDGEVKVVEDFLKMFPDLETLKFTQQRTSDPLELYVKKAREHLNKEKYQGVCPKLTKIEIRNWAESDAFYTTRFPFAE